MATAILKEIFQIELKRTRDNNILNELDIVYDVGGGEFDHHGPDKVYRDDGIPFASCGLIWNNFGKDVITSKAPSLEEALIDSIFRYIDRVLMEGIDALDNGIRIKEEVIPMMSISSIISGFNPPWDSEKNEDTAFNEAVEVASNVLSNTIDRRFSVLKARENVVMAYETRTIPQILVLDTFCPWGEVLREIDEKEQVLFVVYPRKDGYAVQTVRGRNGEDRKQFPESWAGKRDEELAAVTGVTDAVFCHTGRFMAVARSFEGIMKMTELAIKEPEKITEGKFFRFIKRLFHHK